jgi:hypothetical protein
VKLYYEKPETIFSLQNVTNIKIELFSYNPLMNFPIWVPCHNWLEERMDIWKQKELGNIENPKPVENSCGFCGLDGCLASIVEKKVKEVSQVLQIAPTTKGNLCILLISAAGMRTATISHGVPG